VEERFTSPHISFTLFQIKARVLGQDFGTLSSELPWSYEETGFRDIYRLQNLVALLEAIPAAGKSVSQVDAVHGDVVRYTISVMGTGRPITVTDPLPDSLMYVPGSASASPEIGIVSVVDDTLVHWTGTLGAYVPLQVHFSATVAVTTPMVIQNVAYVDDGSVTTEWSAALIANGRRVYLPVVIRRWSR
jgi:uncharacterized repeat protein (TIGR01451 family)